MPRVKRVRSKSEQAKVRQAAAARKLIRSGRAKSKRSKF